MPQRSIWRAQHLAADRIELRVHQRLRHVHDGDVQAAIGEHLGRLEPEQAAADHDRAVAGRA